MRRRLILAIALVAAASVGLLGLPLALVTERTFRDEELLSLQRDTIAATRQIDVAPSPRDRVELPSSGDALAVYDGRGRRVAGRGPAGADAVVHRVLRTGRTSNGSDRGSLLTAVPLVIGERVSGAVRAVRDPARINRRTRRAWLELLGLAAAVILLAGGAAAALGRRLAAPLERLAVAAERLGEGDFANRAPRAGVAELDAVAGALDVTAARLGELIGRERAFSADASHQLRTPLAALRLELEAMELGGVGTAELTAAIGEVERLERTVETLLAVARDVPRERGDVEMVALLGRLEPAWHGPLAAAGRPLRMVVEASSPVVRGSATVIEQILTVLLDNASRHGSGAVTVTVRDTAGWLAIDVADEGAGLPEDSERLFVRRGGTAADHGIGLPLARALADAEGGRLLVSRAAPEPVFTLLLPAAR